MTIMKASPNELNEEDYYCKKCGAANGGSICYTEFVSGEATISHFDKEGYHQYDNYENYDSDGFEINRVTCKECNGEEEDIDDLFTNDVKEVWELRYGEKYPKKHTGQQALRGCKCLRCQKCRAESRIWKAKVAKP